jgi:hypothetical protein
MRQIAFSGCMSEPAQAVDMRIYCARLLEDFSARGGRVVIETLQSTQLDEVASRHDLLVVASGRADHLDHLSARCRALAFHHAPAPNRGRGVPRKSPVGTHALEVIVSPGSGEMIVVPMRSFEPDVTGIGILIAAGGAFESCAISATTPTRAGSSGRCSACSASTRPPSASASTPARSTSHGPRISPTPPSHRLSVEGSSSSRTADAPRRVGRRPRRDRPAHGTGCEQRFCTRPPCFARRFARRTGFDRLFCERVEHGNRVVNRAGERRCNARLAARRRTFRELLAAASERQAVADLYGEGYSHPDRFWEIASRPERTAAFLSQFGHSTAT